MNFSIQRSVPGDHPSLAGHFPGHPIVPGVVMLDLVVQALAERLGGECRLTGIPVVKFMAPLRPDQAFVICFSRLAKGRVQFQCLLQDRLLAQGQLEIEPALPEG